MFRLKAGSICLDQTRLQGRLAILSPSIKPLFVLAPEFDWDIGCEGVAFKSGALELFHLSYVCGQI